MTTAAIQPVGRAHSKRGREGIALRPPYCFRNGTSPGPRGYRLVVCDEAPILDSISRFRSDHASASFGEVFSTNLVSPSHPFASEMSPPKNAHHIVEREIRFRERRATQMTSAACRQHQSFYSNAFRDHNVISIINVIKPCNPTSSRAKWIYKKKNKRYKIRGERTDLRTSTVHYLISYPCAVYLNITVTARVRSCLIDATSIPGSSWRRLRALHGDARLRALVLCVIQDLSPDTAN